MKLLRSVVRKEYLEEIEGDLEEVYADFLEQYSIKKSRRLYNREVLKVLRPALLKPLSGGQKLNYYGMLQHNLLLSVRIFKRYKSSFLINLTGLATGLACVLLIYLWVNDERSIDKFHEKDSRLYQVMGNYHDGADINTWNGMSAQVAGALIAEVPEVEKAISGTDPSWNIGYDLTYQETKVKATGRHVGPDFFNMFSYPLVQGNPDQVLSNKNAIVISEILAKNLFNTTENLIGKTVEWSSMNLGGPVIISGIFSSPPANATDQFDLVLPYQLYADDFGDQWENPNSVAWVLLKEGADLKNVNAKIEGLIRKHLPESNKTLFLQKYSDQYLHGEFENGVEAGGRIEYVRFFSLIAIFILVIACINFMNLSTARASRRIKEVGVKKAVGAGRSSLIFQYLSESMLMSFLSLLVAIGLVFTVLPQFNIITGKQIEPILSSSLIIGGLGITLLTGLISGSYPALYLSGFNPAVVLKGMLKGTVGELWVRKGLVIFQFALSIIFIVGVLVVFKQMQLIQNKALGFDKDQLLYFEREGKTVDNLEPFLQGLKNLPGVENASAINNDMFHPPGVSDFTWEGQLGEQIDIRRQMVYYDFIETLGVTLKDGRSFSRDFPLNKEFQIVLNQKAVELMRLEEPVGKRVKIWGTDALIVGVVEDFHFHSLHESIGPMYFDLAPNFLLNTMVRIKAGSAKEALARMEDFYTEFNPGYTFNYKFLDQDFQELYESENRVAALSRYFAGFAILISALGLLGLVAFSAERRMKEIGIRKILGSGNLRIVYMLSGDFTKMVLAAIVIALPISYYITSDWLTGFAYPIELKWWFFAGAGAVALLVAWLTVGFQTLKAAAVNPVKCLRDE